jgi:hypothetical protein
MSRLSKKRCARRANACQLSAYSGAEGEHHHHAALTAARAEFHLS